MNSKQKKTLAAIFTDPVKSDIEWKAIEGLLAALDADISEGRGSRVRLHLNGIRAVLHRPHPEKVTDKGAVKSMREFLRRAGIEP